MKNNKDNYNNTLSAIEYILNKNNNARKINNYDLDNIKVKNKNTCRNSIKIPSYRKQKEFGLNKFIKP